MNKEVIILSSTNSMVGRHVSERPICPPEEFRRQKQMTRFKELYDNEKDDQLVRELSSLRSHGCADLTNEFFGELLGRNLVDFIPKK